MTERFIDSHTHLAHEDFAPDLSDILARARSEGVTTCIVPATDIASSMECVRLSEREAGVLAAVGIHPHDVAKAGKNDTASVVSLAASEKVVAIGEIGLDYYYDFSPRELQKKFFAEQLEIASELDLPVIVHTRESMEESISMVRDHVAEHSGWCNDSSGGRRGVFHCFTGTEEQARTLFSMGFFVSFPGILTFKKSPVLDVFRALDMERVLLETDAPYMAPVPMRGRRNEPAFMIHTARKMAEESGRTLDQIADITRSNTRYLFHME